LVGRRDLRTSDETDVMTERQRAEQLDAQRRSTVYVISNVTLVALAGCFLAHAVLVYGLGRRAAQAR
jgi:hypothetical protein